MTSTQNCPELYIKTLKRLNYLATTPDTQPGLRWACYARISDACYLKKSYEAAYNCYLMMNKISRGNRKMSYQLFRLLRCCVILRKPCRFYEAALYLIKIQQSEYFLALIEFLKERREYIKIYLLEGTCPESCNILKRLLQMMDNGIAEDYLLQPFKRRLIDFTFAKKMKVQMLHRRSQVDKIRSLLQNLKIKLK